MYECSLVIGRFNKLERLVISQFFNDRGYSIMYKLLFISQCTLKKDIVSYMDIGACSRPHTFTVFSYGGRDPQNSKLDEMNDLGSKPVRADPTSQG